MSTCPNKNLEEWKDLVKEVGEVEAYRDYLETKGSIRTVSDVKSKISERLKTPDSEKFIDSDIFNKVDDNISTYLKTLLDGTLEKEFEVKSIIELMSKVNGDEFLAAMDMAKQISDTLGVKFNLISRTDAKIITDKLGQKYDGVSSFFTNGEVYFVEGSVNMETVLHEFAHPFIRQISKENKQLFNTLYDTLSKTEEGKKIIEEVKENYELIEGSDLFKEEVIVKSLGRDGGYNTGSKSDGFVSFLKDFFYALKKIFREIFNVKISLKDLSSTTTMSEISKMLTSGGKIELNKDFITQEDIISYNKQASEIAEELKSIEAEDIQKLLNENYNITRRIRNTTKDSEAYVEMNEILLDSYNTNGLNELQVLLEVFYKELGPDVRNMSEKELRSRRVELLESTSRLNSLFEKLYDHAKDRMKIDSSDENMRRIYQYEKMFSEYEGFIMSLNDTVDTSDTSSSSELSKVVTNLKENLSRIRRLKNGIAMTNSVDVLTQQLVPVNKRIQEKYDKMVEELIRLKAPKTEIEKKFKEFYGLERDDYKTYNDLKSKRDKSGLSASEAKELDRLTMKSSSGLQIDDEKIELMLSGRLGDMNMFSAFLEGALSSPDVIVGGLAAFVKNKMTEYQVGVQSYANQYADDISQLIRNAGMDGQNNSEIGEKLGFNDIIAQEDDKGNIIQKSVRTLKNMFTGHRYEYQKFTRELKKLREEYSSTGNKDDEIALANKEAEFKKFKYDYFNQRYKKEVYAAEQELLSTELGREAKAELDENSSQLKQNEILNKSNPKQLDIEKHIILTNRSFLHSATTIDGKDKLPRDVQKAELLSKYRKDKNKYGSYVAIEGAFEKALANYEKELSQEFDVKSEEYERLRAEWIDANTGRSLTDEFQQRISNLYSELNVLFDKMPKNDGLRQKENQINLNISDLVKNYKDNDGQVDVSIMPKVIIDKVKSLELEILDIKLKQLESNGLNKQQNARMRELYDLRRGIGTWNVDLGKELTALQKLRTTVDKSLASEISELFSELRSLQESQGSDQYVSIVNQLKTTLKIPSEFDSFKSIDNKNSNDFIANNELINSLMEQSEDFKSWFKDNHYQVDKYNKETGKDEKAWKRHKIWSINTPNSENAYELYELKDNDGNVIEVLNGKPSIKYYKFEVDEEYMTEREVGVTTDNKNNFLPLSRNQNPLTDKFINKEYEQMKADNSDEYKLLEFLQKSALETQENAEHSDKLYYDFPRYYKDTLARIRTNEIDTDSGRRVNYFTIVIEKMKEFIHGGATDSVDRDLNWNSKDNIQDLNRLETIENTIPIDGLFNINSSEVSNDITRSQMQYFASIEKKSALINISPTVYAIRELVKDSNVSKGGVSIDAKSFIRRTYSALRNQDEDNNNRFKAIDAFVKVNFEGKKTKGGINSNKVINNVMGLSASVASWSFFSFNIPSAIKNVYGAKFQTMIEASGGEFFNHIHAQKGNLFAYGAVSDLMFSGSMTNGGAKPFSLQLLDIFDAANQGSFIEDLGKNISDSQLSRLSRFTGATSFRRISEKQATMQVFGSMMHAKMVDITDSDGNKSSIAYIDAWEIRDNKIQLKEGVDPKHGITYDANGKIQMGTDFADYKSSIHGVMVKLQGNYAAFDQPPAARYVAFRAVSFLRRFFTSMAVERFGYGGNIMKPTARLQVGLGTSHKGTYITFGQMLFRMMKVYNGKVSYMTQEEKIATKKVIAELVMLFILGSMLMLLGYDEEDSEKNKKLRALSGALPLPFLTDTSNGADFNLSGFAKQHLVLSLLNIKAENKQLVPLPGYGLTSYYEMVSPGAISVKPFMGTLISSIGEMVGIIKEDPSSYYKREMGPYRWQKKESAKIFNTILKPFGLTGGSINPAKSAETVQKFSAKR